MFRFSMRSVVVSLLTFLGAIGFIACSSVEKHEHAQTGERKPASHSWANYHWARTTPQFTLKLGNNMTTAAWNGHLLQATSDWNSPEIFGATSTPVLLSIVNGRGGKRCSAVTGTSQVCNGKYGRNGWLGLATIYASGDHITKGSAKMNDTYFEMAKYNNPNERLHVVCQEIAHTFGLDHQSEDGSSQNSCMDYFSNTGANATSALSTRPNAHDFEQLNTIYSHLDSTTTVAPMAAEQNLADDVTDDPKTWGEWVREASTDRGAYYQKTTSTGVRIITHVYWTEERAAKCRHCDHREEH